MDEVGAILGDTQRFECKVIGFPMPIIRWFKDGVEITENERYENEFDKELGTITLLIKNLTVGDEGLYQCRAENSEGSATTMTYLSVQMEKINEDFSTRIERVPIRDRSPVDSFAPTRTINKIVPRYEDENELSEEEYVAPKITYDSVLNQPLSIKSGSSLFIEVNVSGYPRPSVNWFHENEKLMNDTRTTMETAGNWVYLKVKSISEEDAGSYKVTAVNSVGSDSASFQVTVRVPPSPPRDVRIIEVNKDFVVLGWTVPSSNGGEKIISYEIEKSLGGSPYVNAGYVDGNTFQHKVVRLREGGAYTFRVSAENCIGKSSPTATQSAVTCKLPYDPPGPPKNLHVEEFSKDFVTIAWNKPETDGGSKIIQYVIEKCDVTKGLGNWVTAGTVSQSEHSFRVSKLFQGNSYLFRIKAENRVGAGPPAELDKPVVADLPYGKPLCPKNLRVTEVDSSYMVLEWETPEGDGGSPIKGYTIEKRDAKRDEFVPVGNVDAYTHKFKATRLFEGTSYVFRVFAENQAGLSPPSFTDRPLKAKAPYDEPDAPRNLRVKEYWTDFVTVTWDAPESDGGSSITGYIIDRRDVSRPTWVKAGQVGPEINTFKAINLIEGSDYVFRVFALNKVGPSREAAEMTQACRAKMPFDPPFAPKNLKTTDIDTNSITLTWEAPEHDGGSPITGYVVEKRDALMNIWTQAGKTDLETRKLKVRNLFEGQSYFFRVAALNQVGRGVNAETTKPTVAKAPFEKPSKPLNLKVIDVWKDYATIIWEEPLSDGGSPITGYTIEQRDAFEVGYRFVAAVDANTNQFQVTNLQEGHEYFIRVYAQNAAGLSEQAAELKPPVKAKLPFEPPSAPTYLRVTDVGDGTVSVAWDAPNSDGGSPVTNYTVETCRSGSSVWTKAGSVDSSSTLAFDIGGLITGDYYFIRCFAENLAGMCKRPAELGEAVCVKRPTKPPGTPTNVRVTNVTPRAVTISWDAPSSDGSSDVAQYYIDVREEQSPEYTSAGRVDGRINSFTTEFLRKGTLYRFRVRSKNSAGFCEPSAELPEPVELLPLAEIPAAPTNLHATGTDSGSISVAWDVPTYDGGSPLTGYLIETCRSGLPAWSKPYYGPANKLDCSIEGLLDGEFYYVRVFAENDMGVSRRSADLAEPVCAKRPTKPPGTPVNLRASNITPHAVTLGWDAALSDDRSEVAQYYIDMKEEGEFEYIPVGRVDGSITSFTTEFLQKGKLYRFRIRARNMAGFSEPPAEMPEPIGLLPVADVPLPPVNLTVTETGDGSISVAWDAPRSNGGSPLTGYVVESNRSGGRGWTKAGKASCSNTSFDLEGLDVGDYYFIRVFAENEIGLSKRAADLSEPICAKKPTRPPGAPKNLRVTDITSHAVTLNWDSPISDGSSDVTQFYIDMKEKGMPEYSPVGRVDGRINNFVADFLRKGKLYDFRVRAKNSAGFGEPPAELAEPVALLKTVEVPSPPTNLRVTDTGDGIISTAWNEPNSDGGSPITGYTLEVCRSGSSIWTKAAAVNGDVLACDLTGLDKDSYYFVRIYSENSAGVSRRALEMSQPVCAKKPTNPPGTPHNLHVTRITPTTLTIDWDAPATTEGVTQYLIEMIEEGKPNYIPIGRVDGTVCSYDADFLQRDKLYSFRVRAKNAAGVSEPPAELPEPVALEKIVSPGPPGNLRVTNVTCDSISLAWEAPLSVGGAPVKRYIIVIKEVTKKKFKKVATVDGSVLSCTVTSGIEANHDYLLRVYAENEAGIGDEGVEIEAPVTIPSSTFKEEEVKAKPIPKKKTEAEDVADTGKVKKPAEKIVTVIEEEKEKKATSKKEEKKKREPILEEKATSLQSVEVLATQVDQVEVTAVETKTETKKDKKKKEKVQESETLEEVKKSEAGEAVGKAVPIKKTEAEDTVDGGKIQKPVEKIDTVQLEVERKTEGKKEKKKKEKTVEVEEIKKGEEVETETGEVVEKVVPIQKTQDVDVVDGGKIEKPVEKLVTVQQVAETVDEKGMKREREERIKVGEVKAAEVKAETEEVLETVAPLEEAKQAKAVDVVDVGKVEKPVEKVSRVQQDVESKEESKTETKRKAEETKKTLEVMEAGAVEIEKVKAEVEEAAERVMPEKKIQKTTEEVVGVKLEAANEIVSEPVEKAADVETVPQTTVTDVQAVMVLQKAVEEEQKITAGVEAEEEVPVKIAFVSKEQSQKLVQAETKVEVEGKAQVLAVSEDKPKEIKREIVEKIDEPETKPVTKADVVFDSEEEEEEEEDEEVEEEVEEKPMEEVKEEVKRLPSGFEEAEVLSVTPESVVLSWQPPSDCGGCVIKSYIIVMCEADKNKYKKVGQISGSTLTYEVTKVKEGHEYLFRVYAENEVGIGTEAAEVKTPVKIPKPKKRKKKKVPTATLR